MKQLADGKLDELADDIGEVATVDSDLPKTSRFRREFTKLFEACLERARQQWVKSKRLKKSSAAAKSKTVKGKASKTGSSTALSSIEKAVSALLKQSEDGEIDNPKDILDELEDYEERFQAASSSFERRWSGAFRIERHLCLGA